MPLGEREEDYERRNNVRVGAKELAQQDVESKCQWEREEDYERRNNVSVGAKELAQQDVALNL